MRPAMWGILGLALSVTFGSAAVASGQTSIAVNYDPLLHELTENSSVGAHGDVTRAFGSIAALGDIGVNHFNQATVITLAPGVRYPFTQSPSSKIQPAAQIVAGLWHCAACEVNAFFFQPGLILDYARGAGMKVRFQFDVRRIHFDFGGETAERVGVGVVWNLR